MGFSIICGLGFGLFQTPNNRNLFLAVPLHRSAAAGGMQGTARLTGQTTGAVLMSLLFAMTSVNEAPRIGLAIGAMLALAAGLVSALRTPARTPVPNKASRTMRPAIITPKVAATVFVVLIAGLSAFQLALAAGVPWGEFAMGGAFPGAFPPALRIAAATQVGVLALVAAVILSRAGLVLPTWRRPSRYLTWAIVVLLAIGVVLNLITPSSRERMIWAPVAIALFLTALRVAVGARHRPKQ